MFGKTAAALVLAALPATVAAQSASAPLVVTATVVASCRVDVPHRALPGSLSTLPVGLQCARHGAAPRVQRPQDPRRLEARGAVVVIDF